MRFESRIVDAFASVSKRKQRGKIYSRGKLRRKTHGETRRPRRKRQVALFLYGRESAVEAQENFTFLFSAGTNDPFEPAGRVEKLLNRGKRGRESRKRGKNRIGRRGEIREEDGKERQRSCGICTCRSGQGLDEPCYRSTSTSIAQQSLSRLLSRARRRWKKIYEKASWQEVRRSPKDF